MRFQFEPGRFLQSFDLALSELQNLLCLVLGVFKDSCSLLLCLFDCLFTESTHIRVKARHSTLNLAHLLESRLSSEAPVCQAFVNRASAGFKKFSKRLPQIPPEAAEENDEISPLPNGC